MKKYVAELIGTMVLVLLGCGSAVFAGGVADTVGAGVGTIGVAMAFGLSVIAMAYTIGNISGCHINPAITLGVWLSGGMKTKRALMYMLFQVVGAIIGSLILTLLVSTGAHGGPTITGSNSFASDAMGQAFLAEAVFTFIFVLVALAATDEKERSWQPGRTGHRTYADTDSHRVYPDYGHIRESGTKHRTGLNGRRTGHRTALALYRGTFRGSSFQCAGVEIPSY